MTGNPSTKPARRSWARWLLPAIAVLVWIVIGGVAGPLAGKLNQVTTTDESAFLPASAESTRVGEQLPAFTDTGFFPAIVVAERAGETALTPEDLDWLGQATAPLAGTPGFAESFSPVLPSSDGDAARQFVPVATDAEPKETVGELRKALEDPPLGLVVAVTGPAGQAADLSNAFGGIDGILLLVAGTLVLIILIAVYRSPILPIVVLISAMLALALACGIVYWLTKAGALELNGQSQGILLILVFGAATDYALLLVARYREELASYAPGSDGDSDDPRAINSNAALLRAWRATLPPISASAGTVILGVLCLLLSDLNSTRSLGPVAAIGIASSFAASITFLPAVLALFGRAAFWPRRPHPATGDTAAEGNTHRIWQRVASFVSGPQPAPGAERAGQIDTAPGAERAGSFDTSRPRKVWAVTLLVLIAGAAFSPLFRSDGISTNDFFLGQVESVDGAAMYGKHFDSGSGTPTWILTPADDASAVATSAQETPGVAAAEVFRRDGGPVVDQGRSAVQVTLTDAGDSLAAQDTVADLRGRLSSFPDTEVGGSTAVALDTRQTAERDRNLVIPAVLVVVFAVLVVLLRCLAAPAMLLATTVLSFATTLGIAALMFNGPFGFPGADPTVPLFAFVFLVALGIDYNIFLMTRAREEARKHGTRRGMIIALTTTGGVISAAGIVLASTFAALAVIPLLFLVQIAFLVSVGVLIDTLIVRSLLVPAMTLDIGRRIWWPSRFASDNTPS